LSLINAGSGFTKGDIETLRIFNHEISNSFYWLIRQQQTWQYTWQVELEELKEQLGLAGKYKVWSNFKARVLYVAQGEFVGTWVEFEYEPIKKGHGAVKEILFKFTNGPKQEKDSPAGNGFPWEGELLRYGVDADKVKMIRHRVRAGSHDHERNLTWDSDYIRFALEYLREDLKEKQKDSSKKKIQNIGGYIYHALTNPWEEIIEYVNERKERILKEIQQELEFKTNMPEPEYETKTENLNGRGGVALKQNPVVQVLGKDELEDWKELHKASPMKEQEFEAFMNHHKYFLADGKWVR
jgi:plasmid replication initiation protein